MSASTNVDRALNDVKDQIAKIRTDLPRTIDEPIVTRLDIEGLPIVTYAASAPGMSVEDLSWFVDDTVARNAAKREGRRERHALGRRRSRDQCFARSEEASLARRDRGANVNAQLRATNVDLAGGRGEIAGQEQAIRTLAGARAVADLAASPIWLPGGRKVRLDDLGTVTDGAAEARTFTRLDGQPDRRLRRLARQGRERCVGRRARREEDRARSRQAASRRSSSPRSTPRSTTRSAIIIRRWRP